MKKHWSKFKHSVQASFFSSMSNLYENQLCIKNVVAIWHLFALRKDSFGDINSKR